MNGARTIMDMVNAAAGKDCASAMRQAYLNWMPDDQEQAVNPVIAPSNAIWEAVTGLLEVSQTKGVARIQHRIFANSRDQSMCVELTHNQTPDGNECYIVVTSNKHLPESMVQSCSQTTLGQITQLPPALEQFGNLDVTLTEHPSSPTLEVIVLVPTP